MESYHNSSERKAYSAQSIEGSTGYVVQAIMDGRNIIEENAEKLFILPRAGE